MKLHAPFSISSRLLPALVIGDGVVQLEYSASASVASVRDHYRWTIDTPAGEFTGTDLSGRGTLQAMFGTLLSFLGAAAESYRYRHCDWNAITEDDNASLFPRPVVEWAYMHSDEISILQMEIEESETALIE